MGNATIIIIPHILIIKVIRVIQNILQASREDKPVNISNSQYTMVIHEYTTIAQSSPMPRLNSTHNHMALSHTHLVKAVSIINPLAT